MTEAALGLNRENAGSAGGRVTPSRAEQRRLICSRERAQVALRRQIKDLRDENAGSHGNSHIFCRGSWRVRRPRSASFSTICGTKEIVVDVAWNAAAQLGQRWDRATPAPSHGQSSLHILKAKAAKAVLADHKPDKVQTMQQRTKAREESWTLDAERLR